MSKQTSQKMNVAHDILRVGLYNSMPRFMTNNAFKACIWRFQSRFSNPTRAALIFNYYRIKYNE